MSYPDGIDLLCGTFTDSAELPRDPSFRAPSRTEAASGVADTLAPKLAARRSPPGVRNGALSPEPARGRRRSVAPWGRLDARPTRRDLVASA